MVFRTAWIACTGALLSFSLSGASGPVGGFFLTRQQQRSRLHLVAQVQQPGKALVSRLLEKERKGELSGGRGRRASTEAAAPGGEKAQQQPRGKIEPAATDPSHDNVKVNDEFATAVAVEGVGELVEQQGGKDEPVHSSTNTATFAGHGRKWRGLSSPLETLSTTGRRLGVRASAAAATTAWGVNRRTSTILRTRGGSAPAPQSPPPPQADRWKYAVEGVKNGLASGLAAACVKTVLQPFDTMKTVQQFSTTRYVLNVCVHVFWCIRSIPV